MNEADGGQMPLPLETAPAAGKRGRKAAVKEETAEAPVTAAVPAQTGDPLAPAAEKPAETPKEEKAPEMSEAESKAAADEAAKDFIAKFKTMDEGVKAARAIMAELFKVARLADLVHAQRIAFIKKLREETAKL
jgi:hypothetical protein